MDVTFTSNASRFGSPVTTGNLDGDAYADVLVGNYDNNNVYIFSGASINGQTTIDSADLDYRISGRVILVWRLMRVMSMATESMIS